MTLPYFETHLAGMVRLGSDLLDMPCLLTNHHSVANHPVIIFAEENLNLVFQTKRRARESLIGRKNKGEPGLRGFQLLIFHSPLPKNSLVFNAVTGHKSFGFSSVDAKKRQAEACRALED